MKIRLLLFSIMLFSFIGKVNAQFQITKCAVSASIQAEANCQGTVPDWRNQIEVFQPAPFPLTIVQNPAPGTLVDAGEVTIVFTASSSMGADSCSATLTVLDNPATCPRTSVPDANFEAALSAYDDIPNDGQVPTVNIKFLTSLDVSGNNIADLTGIEDFESIEELTISNNTISNLNISANTKLKKLVASSNTLTTIDVSASPLLEELIVDDNQLTNLDISANTTLKTVSVDDNQLTNLDVSNNIALLTINANNNDISSIDVSANTSLEILNLAQNELTNASDLVLGTNSNFSDLDVSGNNLEGLNLSGVSNINELVCGNNNLNDIDVNGFLLLEVLYAENNDLTILDVSSNPLLGLLRVNNNDLGFLNIRNGNNVNFVEFNASNNPNLGCIQVDNAADAYAGGGNYAGWQIDGATSAYADQCLTNVPDDNFEQALIDAGYDTTGLDNFVPTANIASVVSFNAGTGGALYNKGITDLTGIEDFVSLIQLWSEGNPLVSIDLSKNTALNTMVLIGTALTDLDLSGNTQLFFAVVRDNNQLTSINLSANTLLTNLTIGNNLLSAIDLSTNTALTKLNINNSSLSSIDLSANVRLDRIFIKDTPLSSLDLNTNTALANLELNATALTSIDLSTNTALSQLIVNNSSLTSLDLSANTVLDYLECTNNLLSNLDLSNNVLLEELYLSDNELTSIDLSTNTALNYLYCNDNELTSLDLNSNTNLMELEVKNNQLTFLNLKNGTNETADLDYFRATGNPNLSCIEVDNVTAANAGIGSYNDWIKDVTASYSESCRTYVPDDNFEQALIDLGYDSGALDDYVPTANIAGLTELSVRYDNIVDLTGIQDFVSLTTLRCDNNDITSLDLSKNTALIDLRCHDNPLVTLDLSANTLLTRVDAFRTELTNINLTGLTQLSILKVSENLFSSIDLSTNTGLTELTISENTALTSIDLSSNTELVKLFAFECQLGSLDLSANTKIEVINVEDNLLTVLDISANTVLESLDIEDNQLSSIDLSANTALRLLWCDNNQLISLDLSTNTNVTRLECENNKLTSLNVKNGSSANISTLRSTSNFNLNCIEVDDPAAAIAGTGNYGGWLKDDSTAYADGCVPFTYVPDDNFEQVLIDLALDDVLDNFVVTSNISGVTTLNLNTQSIVDLTGIEDFAALEILNVNDNQLTRLDLKQNTALTFVQANNNQLQFFSIKNGNNANITTFSATGNADLLCIEVDDETASYLITWQKDATASFGTVCTACTINGDWRISSQAEFDQFISLLGTCNTINGNLTIRHANDITDVSALSNIEVINGKLFIGDNELISSLDGLENVNTVTDGINLSRNDVLNDISALSGIVNPTLSITISENAMLTDITTVLDFTVTELIFINKQTLTHALTFPNVITLTGTNTGNSSGSGSLNFREVVTSSISFPNLTTIEHFFTLRDVDVNTVSFPLLTNVGRSFSIYDAENTDMFDFNALQTVDGFTLDESSVTDLSSFAALTSVGTYLSIGNNPNLISLDALNNVTSTSGVNLYIRNNNALTSLDGLTFVSGSNEIVVIENNPVLTGIDALQGVTSVGYFQIVNNALLTNVNGLSNLTETTETGTSSFQQSSISGNAITSLNLTSLRTVGNQLNIAETGVTNFCGLYSYVADGDGQTTLNLTGSAFTIANILNCENIAPVITLLGDNPQIIGIGTGYVELGATTDDGSDVVIDATDFVDALGSYTITYNATNASGMATATEVTRTVTVADITAPVITLTGDNPQIIERGIAYSELGATTDDGSAVVIDASGVNMNVVGNYDVTYNAADASGNMADQVTRTVNVVDTTAPVITLIGDNPQTIELGSGYTELGATTDDSSVVTIDNSDFVDAVGSYTIYYNATDVSGNMADQVTRMIHVVDNCPLVNLPTTNFTITTSSETCVDKDNGSITITGITDLDYQTTINGQNYSFTSFLEIGDLSPGIYPICIGVESFTNCEQCFEVVIEAAASLSGRTTLSTEIGKARVAVEITTGTAPYTVLINNEVVGAYTANTFAVEVTHGDEVVVFSSLDCEGKISTKVNLFDEVRVAPNPTRGDVVLTLPDTELQNIVIDIYNAIGLRMSSKEYSLTSGRVTLPFGELPTGIYFITINQGAPVTFKIVRQ